MCVCVFVRLSKVMKYTVGRFVAFPTHSLIRTVVVVVVHQFCFQFNRQGTHKTLEKDLVIALMQMVLKDRIASDRLETFCAFLEGSKGYTKITLDQWVSWLDFCHECEDLSTYDEANSAWPVLIDEYVEYMEEKAKK